MEDMTKSWEFKLIFRFFVGITLFAAFYLFAVTFFPIKTAQMKYSDYAVPFLLGSVISGILSAFIAIIAVKKALAGNNAAPDNTLPPPEPQIIQQVQAPTPAIQPVMPAAPDGNIPQATSVNQTPDTNA